MKTFIHSSIVVMLSAISLTACSENNFGPDAEKDWSGTSSFFNATDEKGFDTYYQPEVGRCGDPMPFYDQKSGEFKVLYLQEYDNKDRKSTRLNSSHANISYAVFCLKKKRLNTR